MQDNPTQQRKEEEATILKHKIDDANLQFVVLLQLIIERIEFLETQQYIYGSIKQFLKNSKVKYEKFIGDVFRHEHEINGDTAQTATNKLFVMQERVEKALLNQYILTVDERRERALAVLSTYMIKPLAEKAMEEMESKNLFNF
jgi:hypothetical protein